MEEGRWEDANKEKVRIEEKQRTVRRKRESDAEKAAAEGNSTFFLCKFTLYCIYSPSGRPYAPYKPLWFEQKTQEGSDVITHIYKGSYWETKESQDWSQCPDIF